MLVLWCIQGIVDKYGRSCNGLCVDNHAGKRCCVSKISFALFFLPPKAAILWILPGYQYHVVPHTGRYIMRVGFIRSSSFCFWCDIVVQGTLELDICG